MEGMKLDLRPAIFGSPLRTQILVLTALLTETYPNQLARVLKTSPNAVRNAVERLERERLVATRRWGMERRVTLNPAIPYFAALRALLLRMAAAPPFNAEAARSKRSRPRRRGKPVEDKDPRRAALARELAQGGRG